jgi:hypothetical protein
MRRNPTKGRVGQTSSAYACAERLQPTIVRPVKIRITLLGALLAGLAGSGAPTAIGAAKPQMPWDRPVSSSRWLLDPAAAFHHFTHRVPEDPAPARDPILARLHLPPVPHGSKLPGYLMVADRENNRIIILSPSKKIVWQFPPLHGPGSHLSLPGPDDAFVSGDRRDISVNEELNDTVKVISLAPRPRVLWRYGHPARPGSAHGYLAHPDDAYELANGDIQVADIINCRILWINRASHIVRSIGRPGDCVHNPPRTLSDPNGDTPLPGGGVLVTEIGGWVDRFSPSGRLRWSITTPTNYPSDAQLLPGGNTLVASYTNPGRIDIITPAGRIVWSYKFARGPRALNQPSLAMPLPGGLIAANDDYNHRVVVIDRRTKRIVWQYGHNGVAGSRPGFLNKPDGLQLLP